MTIPEHSMVVLTRNVPEEGLRAGKSGTVVGVYGNGGYEVEFFDSDGDTIAVVTLGEDYIRPLSDFLSCGDLQELCEGWPAERPVWIQSRGGSLDRVRWSDHLQRGGDGEPALVLRAFLWNELDSRHPTEVAATRLHDAITDFVLHSAVDDPEMTGAFDYRLDLYHRDGTKVPFQYWTDSPASADNRGWLLEWNAPAGEVVPGATLHRTEVGARARIVAVTSNSSATYTLRMLEVEDR